MASDNSFDIVSEVNWMEVQNAFQQAHKEVLSRFDFKGTSAGLELEGKEAIVLAGDTDYQLRNVREVLDQKLVRRGVSLKALEPGPIEPAARGTVRQRLAFQNGLDSELAKEIAKFIRGLGLKVQSTIQGDQIRVSAKKKDDLQAVMAAVKAQDWPRALQFTNYR